MLLYNKWTGSMESKDGGRWEKAKVTELTDASILYSTLISTIPIPHK